MHTSFRRLVCLLPALLLALGSFADGNITGSVLTDNGTPIANVAVSDGVTIVQTDANGAYTIPYRDNAEFVFVSVPSGYDIPLDATGSPQMFKRVSAAGTYNFTLHPQADGGRADSSHVMLVFSDPQVLQGHDDNRFRKETVEDVIAFKQTYPAGTKFYGICVGDITWDWYNANSLMKQYFEAMGHPNFMVIGNHDHNHSAAQQERETLQDSVADNKFTATWGPTYYSFNIGAVHYVVLDNVLYKGYNGDKSYNCGFTPEETAWLQADLALVPNGTPVVVSFHIPASRMANGLALLKTYTAKGNVVQHLLSGHTHTNIYTKHSARLLERTMGAAEGAFWCSHWCSDGSPNGYMVYETTPQKGFTTWFYKATGYPKEYQIRTFPVGSIDAGNGKSNCILANVWGFESDKDQVNIYENGVKSIMYQFTGIDPKIYDVMLEEGDTRPNYPGSDGGTIASKNPGAGATSHMFYYQPNDPNAEFVVEYIDRWGNVYTEPVLKNMMVATFNEDANGDWVYDENFDELNAYPNTHSTSSPYLAKGTFVQGHYPEGWYASTSGTNAAGSLNMTWKTFNYFRISEGSHTASGLYNYGAGQPSVKSKNSQLRSLGSLNDNSNKSIVYGVLIENNTKHKITALDVAYTGKVWRVGSSATAIDTLLFSYVVLSDTAVLHKVRDRQRYIGDLRARNLPQLNFVTPSTMTAAASSTVASKIDGDNDANQTRLSANIPVTINPGEVVMLRWTDNLEATSGSDQALAIDDLNVKATVEEGSALPDIKSMDGSYVNKVLHNGQIIIIRNNKKYDILGKQL